VCVYILNMLVTRWQ